MNRNYRINKIAYQSEKKTFYGFVFCSRVRTAEAKRRILLISRILSQLVSCKLACTPPSGILLQPY